MNIHAISLSLTGVILLALGPVFIPKGISQLNQTKAASTWPSVEGYVTRNAVDSQTHRRIRKPTTTTYDVTVKYVYTVDGEVHSCQRVTFGGINRSSESYVERLRTQYPFGKRVDVRYNPKNPAEAVLETEVTTWTRVNIGVGIVGPVLGVLLIIWTLKNTRRADSAPSYGSSGWVDVR
ncbi:MAG: DUF3592 domain-containing protein [Planctomycetota bacterium]